MVELAVDLTVWGYSTGSIAGNMRAHGGYRIGWCNGQIPDFSDVAEVLGGTMDLELGNALIGAVGFLSIVYDTKVLSWLLISDGT